MSLDRNPQRAAVRAATCSRATRAWRNAASNGSTPPRARCCGPAPRACCSWCSTPSCAPCRSRWIVFETQFLRYLMGLAVMLPLMARSGLAHYRPKNIAGQFTRGGVHTLGLCLWFIALPHITIADVTAIGFTGPIFIMLGAVLLFKEPMRWERWSPPRSASAAC
jgi:hypothetical protein